MSGPIRRLYVEEAVADHPLTRSVRARLPAAEVVSCRRYGEVFNRKAQDFRLQKRRPALILAEKFGRPVLEAPAGYGVGGRRNYYFSHLLNCVYDCRYCFLQGMFRSAHYVLFVNYERFEEAIDERLAGKGEAWFFSGYDCDSLAFEPLTGFAARFLPFFAARPRAWLELRTKSLQIGALLEREPLPNCVTAFSFTPAAVHRRLERGVPSIERRVEAMRGLGERGWRLGLRFDPLIWSPDFRERYRALFETIFRKIDPAALHSVSLGAFRLPRGFYDTMYRLYPGEPLLAGPLEERSGVVSLPADREREMVDSCVEDLGRWLPDGVLHPCAPAYESSRSISSSRMRRPASSRSGSSSLML